MSTGGEKDEVFSSVSVDHETGELIIHPAGGGEPIRVSPEDLRETLERLGYSLVDIRDEPKKPN
jgi:hypothetical protein